MSEAAKAQVTPPKKTDQVPPASSAPKMELIHDSHPAKTLAAMGRARSFVDQARVHARKEIDDDDIMIDTLNSLRMLDDRIAEVESSLREPGATQVKPGDAKAV